MDTIFSFTIDLLHYLSLVTFWLSLLFFFVFLWLGFSDSDGNDSAFFANVASVIIALLSGILLKLTS
jgi:hypothetical protein